MIVDGLLEWEATFFGCYIFNLYIDVGTQNDDAISLCLLIYQGLDPFLRCIFCVVAFYSNELSLYCACFRHPWRLTPTLGRYLDCRVGWRILMWSFIFASGIVDFIYCWHGRVAARPSLVDSGCFLNHSRRCCICRCGYSWYSNSSHPRRWCILDD